MKQRELKFRAFHNKGNRVLFDLELLHHWDGMNLDNYTIDQYTGLKDKNGKDIYEGDVVRVNKNEIGSINFNRGNFWVCFYEEPAQQILSEFVKYNIKTDDYDIVEIEIIGNIHENPELL